MGRWGEERHISPPLMTLNASPWEGIEDVATPEGQESLFDLLEWLETFKPDRLGEHGRNQYVSQGTARLAAKYASPGIFLEGVDPATGLPSGDRQLRLEHPPKDGPKYRRPPGGTAQVFFANVDKATCDRVAARHELLAPDPAEFWPWVQANKIPIVLVEGAGDAMGALSRGIVAIGAPGHHMCFAPQTNTLKPELLWILEGCPQVTIAFDQDAKPKTIREVNKSRSKVGKALEALGCEVRVAVWEASQGKGFGDLPTEDAYQAIALSQPFEFWFKTTRTKQGQAMVRDKILNPFSRPHDLALDSPIALAHALQQHTHVFIDGVTGAGKTEAFKGLIDSCGGMNHYHFSPVRSLARSAAATLGMGYLNDVSYRGMDDSVALVINSILKLTKPLYDHTSLYLDEVEQLLGSLLDGGTNREKRAAKVAKFGDLLRGSFRVCAASATATQKDLDYLETTTGTRYTLIRYCPTLHPKGKLQVFTGTDAPGSRDYALGHVQDLALQPRTHIACDSKRETLNLGIDLENKGHCPLIVNQDTTESDLQVVELLSSDRPGDWLHQHYPGQSLITSPSVQSGFSIKNPEGVQLFDQVVGVAKGKSVAPATFLQMLGRYRCDVPRIIYAPRHSSPHDPLAGSIPSKGAGSYSDRQRATWDANAQDYSRFISQQGTWDGYDFRWGAEATYLRELHLQRDLEFRYFAAAVAAYGERDGYQVEWVTPSMAEVIKHKDEVDQRLATPVSHATPVTPEEFISLLKKHEPTSDQRYSIEAHAVRNYYALDWDAPLSINKVIDEGFGKGRKALVNAQRIVWDGKAIADDLARQEKMGVSGFAWDATNHTQTLDLWEKLGIEDALAFCLENPYSHRSPEVITLAQSLAKYRQSLDCMPRLLGIKLPHFKPSAPDDVWVKAIVKWIGQVFRHKLGLGTTHTRPRDENGGRYCLYMVSVGALAALKTRLQQTAKAMEGQWFRPRSTRLVEILYKRVDHPQNPPPAVEDGAVEPSPSPPKPPFTPAPEVN